MWVTRWEVTDQSGVSVVSKQGRVKGEFLVWWLAVTSSVNYHSSLLLYYYYYYFYYYYTRNNYVGIFFLFRLDVSFASVCRVVVLCVHQNLFVFYNFIYNNNNRLIFLINNRLIVVGECKWFIWQNLWEYSCSSCKCRHFLLLFIFKILKLRSFDSNVRFTAYLTTVFVVCLSFLFYFMRWYVLKITC